MLKGWISPAVLELMLLFPLSVAGIMLFTFTNAWLGNFGASFNLCMNQQAKLVLTAHHRAVYIH